MRPRTAVVIFLCGFLSQVIINLWRPIIKTFSDKGRYPNDSINKHSKWYRVQEKYISTSLMEKWVPLSQDNETTQFLKECFDKSEWFFTQMYHGVAKGILTFFISSTSANGLLDRGSMFVLSTAQFKQLVGYEDGVVFDRLLDLGAGDGKITAKFQSFFKETFATEVSSTMRWRLMEKNIKLLEVDSWKDYPEPFDLISCLNLLDRCDHPLTILQDIKLKLRPHSGLLLIALVFPIRQYVESTSDHRPQEVFDIAITKIWEVQFNHFVKDVIEPAGFELLRWARVPYLCEGDFSRSFYYLNDVVMLLRPLAPSY